MTRTDALTLAQNIAAYLNDATPAGSYSTATVLTDCGNVSVMVESFSKKHAQRARGICRNLGLTCDHFAGDALDPECWIFTVGGDDSEFSVMVEYLG